MTHTVGCEVVRVDRQDLVLHLARDPGVHAVADDVVELAIARVDVEDARVPEVDVAQVELARNRTRVVDLANREVDADELRARRGNRHRNQVAAAGTPELEHSRLSDRRRCRSEQSRDRGQPIWMRARMSAGAVRHIVVGGLSGQFRLNSGDGIG